ncbi:hypothetical protein [Acidocella sp. KAb 2-4]|uniref:hypothetical protein n=1 Tax=Acidocella sp. KAb 2-4 TaxID=2885158 RepID=UPI001D08F5C8|nr:hypothetical protein [Acidocella sp. KAb 2-4]MCB5944372.1 hypothetical protein [Acidocella sp. KAb 2-4]
MSRARRARPGQQGRRGGWLKLALALMFLLGLSTAEAATPCAALPHAQTMTITAGMTPSHAKPARPCPCCPDQGACCTFAATMVGIPPAALTRLPAVFALSGSYPLPVTSFLPGRTIRPAAPPPRRIA